jgi:pimeloyl-ACP methyl ester carboxylesterase
MAIRFRGDGDIVLEADIEGDWSGPAVLLLHGGGQTRHAWGGTARALARQGYLSVALDARGHGGSDWSPDARYGLEFYAADLRAVVAQLNRPVALVGASLGGMTAIVAAGQEPRLRPTALVLVDITPRMEPAGRERIGEFMTANPDGFASVLEAADAVSAYLPERPRPKDVSGLQKNLRLDADGRYHWHWDPAFHAGMGSSQAADPEGLEDAARRVEAPILLVRGKRSELISEASVEAFLAVVPTAEYVDVAGAGHMVAGDENDVFSAAIIEFLQRVVKNPVSPDSEH